MVSSLKELVSSSIKGDEKAISELISMHKKLVINLAYNILNDYQSSLDICQETFIKAFKNIKKLKQPEKFKNWICKIALNLTKNELKKRKVEEYYRENAAFSLKIKGDSDRGKSMILKEALKKLKFKDRFILSMYYYQGFNLREISELTNIKEDNLKMILSRARKKLRKKLEGYEYELLSR